VLEVGTEELQFRLYLWSVFLGFAVLFFLVCLMK
jgi:hypothetical protein